MLPIPVASIGLWGACDFFSLFIFLFPVFFSSFFFVTLTSLLSSFLISLTLFQVPRTLQEGRDGTDAIVVEKVAGGGEIGRVQYQKDE